MPALSSGWFNIDAHSVTSRGDPLIQFKPSTPAPQRDWNHANYPLSPFFSPIEAGEKSHCTGSAINWPASFRQPVPRVMNVARKPRIAIALAWCTHPTQLLAPRRVSGRSRRLSRRLIIQRARSLGAERYRLGARAKIDAPFRCTVLLAARSSPAESILERPIVCGWSFSRPCGWAWWIG